MTPMESNANDLLLFLFTIFIMAAIVQGIIDYFKDGTFKKNKESVKAGIIKHEKGIFCAIMFVIIIPALLLFFAFLEQAISSIPATGLIVTFIVGAGILIRIILKLASRKDRWDCDE